MKIKDYIVEKELAHTKERLDKLTEIGAPSVVLKGISEEIERLESGVLNVGGNKDLLDEDFSEREVKKCNGGKVYIQFDGRINYFPNAKYGRFITTV